MKNNHNHHRGSNMTSSSTLPGTSSPTPRGSIFSNFETVQLSTEERLYLHGARLGDSILVREIIENEDLKGRLNLNCVDYMGRNALHLSVDSECVEVIEILMEAVSWECMEEALLHAISKGLLNIVRLIIDHPNYLAGEKQGKAAGKKDAFFRTEEKYQYPPDITALTLAAHRNDHEIVQLFLSRGHTILRPHAIYCQCGDCQVKQNCDSLKRSRSRLNAYKALASPAYMALSSPDPITTTFELRQEMMAVAEVEKEFMREYHNLVEQCMNFACEMMDLCRGTQEVEAVLGEEITGTRDPLARLRLAIQYNEKKFVAHPNCQQHLTNIWYGKDMSFLQSLVWYKKMALGAIAIPASPFLCLIYMVNPASKVSKALRCPVTKFFLHTLSHFIFLSLLALATFGLEDVDLRDKREGTADKATQLELKAKYRPERQPITHVQILIIFWILGLILIECKQLYSSGPREHFQQYYNFMDFSILALYVASYALRFVAQYRVNQAHASFLEEHDLADDMGKRHPEKLAELLEKVEKELCTNETEDYSYFIRGSRFTWSAEDPEIISEALFAVANVLSFARTTYVMPAHELLGPLQISLGRMIGDITRFIVLFLLVLVAFMVGMTNLFRYYGTTINSCNEQPASISFGGLPETVHTLFFSIFGLISLDKLNIQPPYKTEDGTACDWNQSQYCYGVPVKEESTIIVDRVGKVLFAVYQVTVIIVLVNMLIAMMSHSFEAIQGDNDIEWKFARAKLWMGYIDESSTLPVPFNVIPTPKNIKYVIIFFKNLFKCPEDDDMEPMGHYDFNRRRGGNVLHMELDPISARFLKKTTYSDIIQRLVRRYLFKKDREKYDNTETERVSRVEDIKASDDIEEEEVLQAIKEDPEDKVPTFTLFKPSPKERSKSMTEATHLAPPEEKREDPLNRSSSAEALRQLTRRATIRRSGKGARGASKAPSSSQLDAIQRGQKLLDARLQDLQTQGRSEEDNSKDTVEHIRKICNETQKAMGSMVVAVASQQDDIRSMANLVTLLYQKMSPAATVSSNVAGPFCARYGGTPSPKPSPSHLQVGYVDDRNATGPLLSVTEEGEEAATRVPRRSIHKKGRARLATLKMSLKRKKSNPAGAAGTKDDLAPV